MESTRRNSILIPLLLMLLLSAGYSEEVAAVAASISFSSATSARITSANLTMLSIPEDDGEGFYLGSAQASSDYKLHLTYAGNGTRLSYSSVYWYGTPEASGQTAILVVPQGALGKPLELALTKDGKMIAESALAYCGDGTCSRGETAGKCPADCKVPGLAPQQSARTIPFVVGGMVLILLAGLVLVITRKSGN